MYYDQTTDVETFVDPGFTVYMLREKDYSKFSKGYIRVKGKIHDVANQKINSNFD